jgi:hypothetical protein
MEGPGRKGGERWAMSFPIAEKKSCPINSSPQTKLLLYTLPKLSQLGLILLLVYWDSLSDVSFPGTLASISNLTM